MFPFFQSVSNMPFTKQLLKMSSNSLHNDNLQISTSKFWTYDGHLSYLGLDPVLFWKCHFFKNLWEADNHHLKNRALEEVSSRSFLMSSVLEKSSRKKRSVFSLKSVAKLFLEKKGVIRVFYYLKTVLIETNTLLCSFKSLTFMLNSRFVRR